MRKILSTLVAVLCFTCMYAQNSEVRGVTITGIKGIRKSIATLMAYDKAHPIPANFKPKLRPEREGPEPKGQAAGAKAVNKFGTLVIPGAARTTATSAPTQSVYSNFLTIWGNYGTGIAGRESPYTPPDNCGDVGTTQIIATANTRMKVFTKPSLTGPASLTPTGTSTTTLTAVVNVDLNSFFANSALGITSMSDPHVRFDRLTGRWFVVAIEVDHNTNNYCAVAVSDGPTITATSNFTIFYFNVSQTGGSSADFYDYPTLGVDKNSLYIGGNMFANGSSFSGSNLWVINKANLIAGTLTVTGFPHGVTNTNMYTPQGVHNDDPSATSGYFIGASQTVFSKLVIRRVTYSGSTPSLSGDIALTTSTTYTPKTVPTLGGIAIDGDDRRLCAAMIKKNNITGSTNLWVAQGTLLNISGVGGSGGDRDGALWMEIGNLAGTPTILQAATMYDGTHAAASAEYYTYPTIALSGQGHNLMGFTSAGPAKHAQAATSGRYRTDPAGNMQAPVDFTNTGSTYSPGANRWGDYTQTVVDPSDDMTMWTFTEYAPTTNAWGVRAGQFKAPLPATPALAAIPACGATTNVTINGTSTLNSEFFDPGADAGGPGFNHLTVTVSGPSAVTVSNVVFVNPLQLTANFTVPAGAASGTYTVTVTNPDGQTSSTTFDLNCTPAACGNPTGLTSSSVTASGASLKWNTVPSATSYSVDYKATASGTWINAATVIIDTTTTLAGLASGTSYDWRVVTTCPAGNGSYVSAQFTTLTVCDPPTGLNTTAITSSSATVNWTAVSGASNYDVDYRVTGTGTWTTAVTGTTSLSQGLSILTASTNYDWQVRANCSGVATTYTSSSFTTASVVVCPDQFEPGNNNISTPTAVPAGVTTAQIGSATDVDYYSFSTSGNKRNLKVTLTNLPANYDLTLYSSANAQLATSTNPGTADEVVTRNTNKAASYKVKVAGVSGAFSSTLCYTLTVTVSNNTFTASSADESINTSIVRSGLKLYPVPATNAVNISFDAFAKGNADIIIVNQLGQQVLTKKVAVDNGTNFNTLDVSLLKSGVYTVKVNNGKDIQTTKMIISK
ncbi:MAG: fibronectin type III domain-containing protein [Chitinophagaceae bacterium]|nr:fibronectin type III domain-containing protein [Chitinophagaceae bacterium]